LRQPANDFPHRGGSDAAHLVHVAPEGIFVDLEFEDFLVQNVIRDAIEEELDRQDHHSQVVDAPKNRNVVRDDVTTDENVACRHDQ
jgi:hypothetical protein